MWLENTGFKSYDRIRLEHKIIPVLFVKTVKYFCRISDFITKTVSLSRKFLFFKTLFEAKQKTFTVPVELFDVFEGEKVKFQLDFQECETLN